MPRRSTIGLVVLLVVASCASEPAPVTAEDYLASLQEICVETTTALDALPTPPEEISVTDFATSAADLLSSEAEDVRQLEAPDELEADHRAFVLNTDEQARAWRALADAPAEIVDTTTLIGQLTLGRDDLAAEIGATDCLRSDG